MSPQYVPTARLVRRVAQAVDGYRTGEILWVVVSKNYPHEVDGVFSDEGQAQQRLEELGDLYTMSGPIQSEMEPETLTKPVVLFGCHKPDSKPTMCLIGRDGETLPLSRALNPTVRFEDVVRIVVQLWVNDPSGVPQQFGGDFSFTDTDALFFTLSAVDKFLIPYTTRAYDVDTASALRQDFADYVRTVNVVP